MVLGARAKVALIALALSPRIFIAMIAPRSSALKCL
jgi:hypothetical protein